MFFFFGVLDFSTQVQIEGLATFQDSDSLRALTQTEKLSSNPGILRGQRASATSMFANQVRRYLGGVGVPQEARAPRCWLIQWVGTPSLISREWAVHGC